MLAHQDGLENKIIFGGHQNQEISSYYYSLADILYIQQFLMSHSV
jgi:hypothetical protein